MTDSQAQVENTSLEKIGNLLKKTREEKKLSLGDVAHTLKIPLYRVESIENGNLGKLPDAVFTRGFIRTYSRLLEIEDKITPLLDTALPNTTQHESLINSHNIPEKRQISIPPFVWFLLVIGICLLAVYSWQNKSSEQNKKQNMEQSKIVVNTNNDVPPIAQKNVVIVPLPAASIASVARSNSPDSIVLNPNSNNQKDINNDILNISIKYRSYLTVSDKTGKVFINQIVPGGSQFQFSGTPPYQVRIGYAFGSSVTLNNQDVNVKKYITNKTATFTVPENK